MRVEYRKITPLQAVYRLERAKATADALRTVLTITDGTIPNTARKIRSAIKSADGAVRNAKRWVPNG